MKKNKMKVTSNDVLSALSIRVNDLLKTTRKGTTDKTNSAYFWLFKLILLMLYIWCLVGLFDAIRSLGVVLIYHFGKSLRSIISVGWVAIITMIKGISILYLLYSQVCCFIDSAFYKKLYHTDKPMCEKKDKVFTFIKYGFKGVSIAFLALLGLLAALSLFVGVLFIKLLLDGVYVISPIIICLTIFVICYLAFKSIQNKFLDTKPEISHNSIILALIVLIIGFSAFYYETSSYEYVNELPLGFETVKQVKKFDLSKIEKINVKADTKLNTIKVLIDNDLLDEMRVELEYFETADVSYIYNFKNDNELNLEITSKLDFKIDNVFDVFKLASATFNNNTIYNYNLFKYPNITIYINENMSKNIITSHN